MKRIDATVDDEGNGKDDGHTRKRPQTPTPLRYCGQIIVDKSIGINVVLPISSKFPLGKVLRMKEVFVTNPKEKVLRQKEVKCVIKILIRKVWRI